MDLFLRKEKKRGAGERVPAEKKTGQWSKIFIVSALRGIMGI